MPSTDDIIALRLRSEQQGVAMQNTLYYIIEDIGNSPSIVDAVTAFATAYVDSFRSQLSIQWALTCILYQNITEPTEPDVPVFMTEAGSEVTIGPHPANQTVNVTRYGAGLDGKLKYGSLKISGLHKDVSKTGRVESDMELGTLEAFLRSNVVVPALGWNLRPQFRYRAVVGPPAQYEYVDVQQVITQGVFSKLRSRSTSLCATS